MQISDLAAHLQPMVGDLRGADCPREDLLQRLFDLNPNYRLTHVPEVLDRVDRRTGAVLRGRPALWFLHEVRPQNAHDVARRIAAQQRLERWTKANQAFKDRNPSIPAQCADMIAGYWTVGSWPAYGLKLPNGIHLPGFGTDAMLAELSEGEEMFKAQAARLNKEAALDAAADEEALLEYDENPDFRATLADGYRQVAKEDWGVIFAGRMHSIPAHVRPQGASDGATDR